MILRGFRLALGAAVLGGAALGLTGCENAGVKVCHAEMQTSQQALLKMDKADAESVAATLGLIERTLSACRQAQRQDEVTDILDAKRQVGAHLEALEKRANQPARGHLSAGQLQALVKTGDPDCPRGQGYEHAESKQLIKCSGKQLVEMPWLVAREYFEKRGYGIQVDEKSASFKAEFGANAYVFTYEAPLSRAAPLCLSVTGKPGVPWQEIVARATGIHPDKLEKDRPLAVGARSLPLAISGEPAQWSVALGACTAHGAETGAPHEAERPRAPEEKALPNVTPVAPEPLRSPAGASPSVPAGAAAPATIAAPAAAAPAASP